MALEMTRDYRLRWLDFDKFGHITPTAVLDMLQDVAVLQAEEMGIGRDAMLESNNVWVAVRIKYEVVREPVHSQVVCVRTWPHSLSSFSFMRDFHICDEQGEVLIKASSEWVLMNIETRKFAKAKDCYNGPRDFLGIRAFDGKMRKVANFDEDTQPVYTVMPAFSDIDVNGHVNNARYPTFVMDALNPSHGRAIQTLQIDYRYEVAPQEPLAVHARIEDNTALVKGVREDGVTAFACRIELRPEEGA